MERKTKAILLIILTLIIALALIIIVFASLRKNEDNVPDTPQSSESDDVSKPDLLPSIVDPVYEGNDISQSPFVGSFRNSYVTLYASKATDVFEKEDEIPFLTINADGSFELKIFDAEVKTLSVCGRVTVDGETAIFSIEERPESTNFLGVDVEQFKMTLADADNMRYSGDPLGSISKGDVFSRYSG